MLCTTSINDVALVVGHTIYSFQKTIREDQLFNRHYTPTGLSRMASISPFFYTFLSLEDGAPKHIDTSSLPRCHSKNYATFFQGINQNLVVEKVAFPGFSVTLLPCKSSPISLSIDCTSWVAHAQVACPSYVSVVPQSTK